MVEIKDFVSHAPVPAEIIAEYRDQVPAELVEVWEQYGYGTFGRGFLRVIDPKPNSARSAIASVRRRVMGSRSRSW
ncbi:hypothetical protein JOF28_001393 [Leucobacter exalbidus]|uniref:GAD-related domain-containing protein n=1 Tax=Leucobacter exalbidus TaxID=662960 RepID=A0A940T5N3_9MICO|nr:GAD-like domain-containing protein [Leucobacter exalbidus]MBP1326161.1 hypothetical protein [Leucobacter exalbidus]